MYCILPSMLSRLHFAHSRLDLLKAIRSPLDLSAAAPPPLLPPTRVAAKPEHTLDGASDLMAQTEENEQQYLRDEIQRLTQEYVSNTIFHMLVSFLL